MKTLQLIDNMFRDVTSRDMFRIVSGVVSRQHKSAYKLL